MGRTALVAAWIVGNGVCGALVALPDDDDRLFSISDLHGPSPVDAVGATGLVALWVPVIVATVRAVRRKAPRVRVAVVLAAVSLLAVLAVTILGDLGWWWLAPAMGLGALQLAILWSSRRRGGG